jgi:hypothetical protein
MTSQIETLSHYTDFRGLVGIVKSQSLRATEFSALNDSSEFIYALQILSQEAMRKFKTDFPDKSIFGDALSGDYAQNISNQFSEFMKTTILSNSGYGSYFTTSFARGKNKDEDERGILTLWDRYTQLKGFCLQFDGNKIIEKIRTEADRYSYELIDAFEVEYGVDRNSAQFTELSSKLCYFTIESVLRDLGRYDLSDQKQKPPSFEAFAAELILYCLRHKDPQFVDEREFRIVASPHAKTLATPFTGLKLRKEIHGLSSDGRERRYIVLGEDVFPGIRPKRVVVGPKVEPYVHEFLLELWAPMPTVESCRIPIR